jgi:hypothetical protein
MEVFCLILAKAVVYSWALDRLSGERYIITQNYWVLMARER